MSLSDWTWIWVSWSDWTRSCPGRTGSTCRDLIGWEIAPWTVGVNRTTNSTGSTCRDLIGWEIISWNVGVNRTTNATLCRDLSVVWGKNEKRCENSVDREPLDCEENQEKKWELGGLWGKNEKRYEYSVDRGPLDRVVFTPYVSNFTIVDKLTLISFTIMLKM